MCILKMKINKALFIVDSPFQVICALEAISYYRIDEPHFLLQDDIVACEKTLPLVKQYKNVFIIERGDYSTRALFNNVRKKLKKKYETIFIGDYYAYWEYVVATILSKPLSRFIYLDDGNSTLAIVPPLSRRRGIGRGRIWYNILILYNRFRLVKDSLFTIYDLGNQCSLPYEKNLFSSLKGNNVNKKNGVYVIGTNSDALHLRDKSYKQYLESLNDYIKKVYPTEVVYYCPHRMDSTDYTEFVRNFQWLMFKTEYSVEIDFVRTGITPLFVVGFGSTALLTLKFIYPYSDICTIFVNLQKEEDNIENRLIEEYLYKNGVRIVKLF